MRNLIPFSALAIVFAVVVGAVLFRYEYLGPKLGFEIRADRWTGCIETWNNNEKNYKKMDKSC